MIQVYKRFYNSLRIGKAIRTIPEEYKSFFTSKNILTDPIYDPKLKLILHLNETIQFPPPVTNSITDETVLLAEGVKEANKFLGRLRFLMKWGHFYWRLSDLSALRLEPQRIIKPTKFEGDDDDGDVEMKVHWQLKVDKNDGAVLIEDAINLKSFAQIQFQRFFPSSPRPPAKHEPIVQYTGISRYVFSGRSGLCTEFHVERIEPKISKSKIEWKWRLTT